MTHTLSVYMEEAVFQQLSSIEAQQQQQHSPSHFHGNNRAGGLYIKVEKTVLRQALTELTGRSSLLKKKKKLFVKVTSYCCTAMWPIKQPISDPVNRAPIRMFRQGFNPQDN